MTVTIERRPARPVPAALAAALPPVLARVYAARDVADPADLDLSLERMHHYRALAGIDAAAAAVAEAITAGRRLLVAGDYDADGATGCAVAVRALRALGAREVGYRVPVRHLHGYGLTPALVDLAARASPDLLITVDTGIASHDGVEHARRLGIPVVITDHHLPGPRLPDALAIVNPNQPGDDFPSKALAGVGVVFYLMLAVRARLESRGWFGARRPRPNLASLLDLVALGTVADVVPLDHNNRILVRQGLARIRAGRAVPGIRALLELGRRAPERAVAADLGYAVAPRLNAAGRLEDITVGIECLLADDEGRARALATELDRLNRERRDIEADMQTSAMAALDELAGEEPGALPAGLCLYRSGWHPGVVGIVAGRVKDRTHRPVIAFAADGDGRLKGSARSVPGLHVRDAIAEVAARHPGLVERFGGHAMAAGLSIAEDSLADFGAAFARAVRARLPESALRGRILSDGSLAAAELGVETARALRDGGPWGCGFPEPVFDGTFDVLSHRVVGERHLQLVLDGAGRGRPLRAIAFGAVEAHGPRPPPRLRLAYRLAVDDYRGGATAQLVVEHAEPVAPSG